MTITILFAFNVQCMLFWGGAVMVPQQTTPASMEIKEVGQREIRIDDNRQDKYEVMSSGAIEVRNGFMLSSSRKFGEKFVESVIRNKYRLKESKTRLYDAKNANAEKCEIKGVRAWREDATKPISFLDEIKAESRKMGSDAPNNPLNRMVTFNDFIKEQIIANVQNIKLSNFDILYYCVFYKDRVQVFRCKNEVVSDIHRWCPNHGSKEKGQNGQFPISKDNIDWHLDHCLVDTMSYDEIYQIAVSITKT